MKIFLLFLMNFYCCSRNIFCNETPYCTKSKNNLECLTLKDSTLTLVFYLKWKIAILIQYKQERLCISSSNEAVWNYKQNIRKQKILKWKQQKSWIVNIRRKWVIEQMLNEYKKECATKKDIMNKKKSQNLYICT